MALYCPHVLGRTGRMDLAQIGRVVNDCAHPRTIEERGA